MFYHSNLHFTKPNKTAISYTSFTYVYASLLIKNCYFVQEMSSFFHFSVNIYFIVYFSVNMHSQPYMYSLRATGYLFDF